MCSRPGVVGCAFGFILCVVLRAPVYVVRVACERLQAGGAPFSVGKLYYAMQAFVRCRFAYRASRTCTHVSTLEVRPFFPVWNLQCAVQMLCDDGCKQAQWFDPTLSLVLAQSETAGERFVRNSAAWPRSTNVYWRCVYIMGAPLVHDICVRCVVCALVLSATVQ